MNIILLLDDGGGNINDLRCNMLRCVSNLSIILLIGEGEWLTFDKVRMYDDFMKCMDECKGCIYQCTTCQEEQKDECGEQNKKSVFFCRSCKMRKSCHPIDHDFKELKVQEVKGEMIDLLETIGLKCGCHCNV